MGRRNRLKWQRLAFTAILGLSSATHAYGSELKILSLNLHGYHPMGESERYLQSRDLKVTSANSDLSYFTLDELERGQSRQLNAVRDAVAILEPHVVLLQEVGAGLPNSSKNCAEFMNESAPYRFGSNSAVRLRQRLRDMGFPYDLALACRGNVGWWTSPDSYKNSRVVKVDKTSKATEVIFDFDSNPYPNGMIVEGTAILVRDPWKLTEKRVWRLPIPSTGEEFFFQTARISDRKSSQWALVANLHGGHKVRHFEQAVAMRTALAEYVNRDPERSRFAGVIIGGDFNARLYRPSTDSGEISTIPWEVQVKDEFEYGPNSGLKAIEELKSQLWNLNVDSKYKPWGSVGEGAAARVRVDAAVDRFFEFVRSPLLNLFALSESLETVKNEGLCIAPLLSDVEPTCPNKSRIDLVYASDRIQPTGGAVVFSKNNYRSLRGLSDHPGIYLKFQMN